MEELECIKLLARTDELNGLACNIFNRKCRTASGIAVHLGEDNAGDVEQIVKCLCYIYSILTEHCVDGKQYLGETNRGLDFYKLLHQLLVDVQTARGIDKYHIVAVLLRVLNARLCNLNGGYLGTHTEHGHLHALADYLQLIYCRRSVNVAGYEQGIFTL